MRTETVELQHLTKLLQENQSEVAKRLGISQPMVSLLLREKVTMHGSTRLLIQRLIREYSFTQ